MSFHLRDVTGWFGDDPAPAAPRNTEPDDAELQSLLKELDARMPTLERGRDWLFSVRAEGPFLHQHRDAMLAAVPALRIVATRGWVEVIEDPAYAGDLTADQILRLLGAMLVWQVIATQRAFAHLEMEAEGLEELIWSPLLASTDSYLRDQDVQEELLGQIHTWAGESRHLMEVARTACQIEGDIPELIAATQEVTHTTTVSGIDASLASAWRVMDAATVGALYRSFGEQVQGG